MSTTQGNPSTNPNPNPKCRTNTSLDIQIIDDNASFASSASSNYSHSFSLSSGPREQRLRLRRRRTLQRLSQWVSKRTSRQYDDYNSPGLRAKAIGDEYASVSESYAVFCDQFTASGEGNYYHQRQKHADETSGLEQPQLQEKHSQSAPPGRARVVDGEAQQSKADANPTPDPNTRPKSRIHVHRYHSQNGIKSATTSLANGDPSDRRPLFIEKPPQSILDIKLDPQQTYTYPTWRQTSVSTTHPIPEEEPSISPPTFPPPHRHASSPSSSSSLKTAPSVNRSSFAERMQMQMRGRKGSHNRPSHPPVSTSMSRARTTSESAPPPPQSGSAATPAVAVAEFPPQRPSSAMQGLYPTPPPQIFTPALHYHSPHQSKQNSSSSNNNNNNNDMTINSAEKPVSPLRQQQKQLRRRQSIWQPLKSKFSLLWLRMA